MDQLLRGTAASITAEFRDSNWQLVDPTPATPPVSITDGGGTVVTTGTATKVGTGVYSFLLTPTQTANLDVYTATWTPTIAGLVNTYTTEFEVVGGFYFSIGEARNFGTAGGDPGMDDQGGIPDQVIVDVRSLVQERFEREAATAFVPRGARTVVDGDPWNPSRIVLRRPETAAPVNRVRKVNSVVIDSVPLTGPQMAGMSVYSDEGIIQSVNASFFGFGYRNIAVWYEYGYDQCPLPVKRAALVYARYLLLSNNQDNRQISATNEMNDSGGVTQAHGPGRFRPTGLPDVDSVLWRYCDRIPGFA